MQFVLVLQIVIIRPTNCSIDTPLSSTIYTFCYRIGRVFLTLVSLTISLIKNVHSSRTLLYFRVSLY